MGHSAVTHDDALVATTSSVGCTAALLPRVSLKTIVRWFHKEEKDAAAKGKRNSISTNDAPYLEIDSTLADLLDDETWDLKRRRFKEAHRVEKAAAQLKARESKRARSEQEVWLWGPPPWQM